MKGSSKVAAARLAIRLVCAALLPVVTGCVRSGRLNVDPVAVSSQKPGNVALYVNVTNQGAAVRGLDEHAFQVFENGVPLDSDQVKLQLLPTATSTTRRVALLVDVSKPLSEVDRKTLSDALRPFIAELQRVQTVSLYGFDGAKKARFVVDYPRDEQAEVSEKDAGLARLLTPSRRDSSSSLYSAVLDGAEKLNESLASEARPIRSGTVVIVARNPDLAGHADEAKTRDFVATSPHRFFLLTIGTWARASELGFLGRNGVARAASVNTLSSPMQEVARAVAEESARAYLLAYCSPSREGTRIVRLEVTTRDAQGHRNVGSYQTEFDAQGFGPGCDPLTPPQFALATASHDGNDKSKNKPKAVAASGKVKAPLAADPPASLAASPAAITTPTLSRESDSASDSPAVKNPEPKPSPSATMAEPPRGLGYE